VLWNEEIGELQLKCVAYTGNNMRKQKEVDENKKVNWVTFELNLLFFYYLN
jgi:hypothetical protein